MSFVGLFEHNHEVIKCFHPRGFELLNVCLFLEAVQRLCVHLARGVRLQHCIKHVVEGIAEISLIQRGAQGAQCIDQSSSQLVVLLKDVLNLNKVKECCSRLLFQIFENQPVGL